MNVPARAAGALNATRWPVDIVFNLQWLLAPKPTDDKPRSKLANWLAWIVELLFIEPITAFITVMTVIELIVGFVFWVMVPLGMMEMQ